MRRASTCFLLLLLLPAVAALAGELWPLKREIDLSSGFGDMRFNRFHAGIDLRTGGVSGADVISPVDGWVYRVKYSYYGYGKGLYIMGDDGFIYVFGHLSKLATKIESGLRQHQVATKRYYCDIYFPRDSVRVGRGELIALSGQTGAGAPHLHFEKRTGENQPVNPLVHGFELNDKTRPTIDQLGITLTDDNSLMPNGRRDLFLGLSPGPVGKYRLDTVLYLQAPFGLSADCFDQMRPGGMKQAVYNMAVYFDDKLYYQVVFDTLPFEVGRIVNLEYDHVRAAENEKRVRRLYHRAGNAFSGSRAPYGKRGQFGLSGESFGLHSGRVVATDAFGNTAEATFDFVWGPSESIWSVDSTRKEGTSDHWFYLSPFKEYTRLGIDSVGVFVNTGNIWSVMPNATVTLADDGRVEVYVNQDVIAFSLLRLIAFSNGALIRDVIFNGVQPRGKSDPGINHAVVDDGLLIEIEARAKQGSDCRVDLYYQGKRLGSEPARLSTMIQYFCFVPPRPEYDRIDQIGVSFSYDTTYMIDFVDSLNIVRVGGGTNREIAISDSCFLVFDDKTFYEPRFLEVRGTHFVGAIKGARTHNWHYEVLPEVFALASDYTIRMLLPGGRQFTEYTGVCWLDKKENRWVWLENEFVSESVLEAQSSGGGSFVGVMDLTAPKILYLNLENGRTYRVSRPSIEFKIDDTLAGIEDDRNILIRLDGEWLIPEFDPESGQVTAQPHWDLADGEHHLGIEITDRAGNAGEQYLRFIVKRTQPGAGRGH